MSTHFHHIIPKHVGGTDDPSNLVELTIEDHAIAHKVLYGLWKREEDKIAWLVLSGQIDCYEALILAKKTPAFREKKRLEQLGKKKTKEHVINMSAALKGRAPVFAGKRHTEETKRIISKKRQIPYKIVTPAGESLIVENLPFWCKSSGLIYETMKWCAQTGKSHKGYMVMRV